MGFLDDWEELKEAYDDAAAKARKGVWSAAKEVIKEKGDSKAIREFFDGLKDLIEQELLLGRKPTGMTPVLRKYDKLIPAMEEMIEQQVSGTDDAWKPYVKQMNGCTRDFAKALAAVETIFGKVVERQADESRIVDRSGNLRQALAGVQRILAGKSKAAEAVLIGAKAIKADVNNHIQGLQRHFARDAKMQVV